MKDWPKDPKPAAVQFGTPLSDACELMRTRKTKALPVTDGAERIVGIVTMADFMRSVRPRPA